MRSPGEEPELRALVAAVQRRTVDLREVLEHADPDEVRDFREKLLISWIYHDNALEGVVLSYHELKCAIDQNIVSDVSLIPTYDEVRGHKAAVDLVVDLAIRKRANVTLDVIKRVHCAMTPEVGDPKLVRYRKDTPLHRLYFHDIAPPDKISYRMRRLMEWLGSAQARAMHPIKLGAKTHFRLMHIYPFSKNSGKLARLMMNLILLRSGYEPGIIHATERQRYYETMRIPHNGLTRLICESLLNSTESMLKHFEERTGYQSNGTTRVAAT